MTGAQKDELTRIALEVRKDVVRMLGVTRSRGLSGALAVADILVFLYCRCMNASSAEKKDPHRDRFVLSEGSALPTLYACLANRGYFRRDELWSYRRLGAMLQGYPDIRTPGIDGSGGLYGCGVGVALGLCLANRIDGIASRVFCLIGDAEFQEGVVWESLQSASRNRLDSLVMIVDANEGDPVRSPVKDAASLRARFEAFGWHVCEADGHDFSSLQSAVDGMSFGDGRPKALIARTKSGAVEGFLHKNGSVGGRPISKDDIDQVISILDSKSEGNGSAK
jgi:transketolase